MLSNISNNYISTCTYSQQRDPFCPVFLVDTILQEAEPNAAEREQMLEKGGVVQVEISWNCNYDRSEPCLPKYSFSRFDLPFAQASAASGFNFRFAEKFEVAGAANSTLVYRRLTKAFGLRFVISVSGKAGKFDAIPLLITIGAGLGLLGVATLIADFILLNFTSKRTVYRQIKQLRYGDEAETETEPEAEVN